jgi:class 3 adenylate cyclase
MSKNTIINKKLKAIVFTDIADFTNISSQNEAQALQLIDKQREIIQPLVENYNGSWLKELGDGLLLSFDSTLDAVRCSIEIQNCTDSINNLNLRIGIHQGDIFIKDGDVFGDDVNIASRVESYSPIGGIAISNKVSQDISGVSDIKTSFIGHGKLKGVKQETKIRCIVSHNLPKNKTNFIPLFAAYASFFLSIVAFMGIISCIFAYIGFNDFSWYSNDGKTVIKNLILQFKNMIIYLIVGYSCMSFLKGVSIKSQKWIVFLAYMTIFHMFFEFLFHNQNQHHFFRIIKEYPYVPLTVFGLPILIIFIFRIYYKSRKNT